MNFTKLLSIFALTFSTALFVTSCASKQKTEMPPPVAKTVVKEPERKPAMAYTCMVAGDTREISVEKTPERCEVFYKKYGKKSQVGWAEATPTICSDVSGKIRTNIESAGFSCNP